MLPQNSETARDYTNNNIVNKSRISQHNRKINIENNFYQPLDNNNTNIIIATNNNDPRAQRQSFPESQLNDSNNYKNYQQPDTIYLQPVNQKRDILKRQLNGKYLIYSFQLFWPLICPAKPFFNSHAITSDVFNTG